MIGKCEVAEHCRRIEQRAGMHNIRIQQVLLYCLFGIASRLIEIPPADKILCAKNKACFYIFYQFLIS